MSSGVEASRNFYKTHVAGMIHEQFGQYEDRIAVGLAGEGSDCFGYDDLISRDHDFGTGVCLWLTDEDMQEYGEALSAAYERLAAAQPGNNLSVRLAERRGVMSIHDFYSNILGIDCNVRDCLITIGDWQMLDHTCLATAVNGEVFRDDLGVFGRFRKLLQDYYPDRVWMIRIVNELHAFSSALQVNYARCMTRGDVVAARLCHLNGLKAAMELFFLMKRVYPPYYKWTYRKLEELDGPGTFSDLIRRLSDAACDPDKWIGVPYRPDVLNASDRIVEATEQIAGHIVRLLQEHGLIRGSDPYLERYVDEMLARL